jgi:hypothetical protein
MFNIRFYSTANNIMKNLLEFVICFGEITNNQNIGLIAESGNDLNFLLYAFGLRSVYKIRYSSFASRLPTQAKILIRMVSVKHRIKAFRMGTVTCIEYPMQHCAHASIRA